VGTRNLTLRQAKDLADVGRYLASQGDIILSGNAEGADHAFVMGANEVNTMRVKLYLPWGGFRAEHVSMGNRVILPTQDDINGAEKVWKIYRTSAYGFTDWESLSDSTKKLMGRNWGIISNSERVIAAPSFNDYGPKGGTGFALNIADYLSKPVRLIDFRKPEDPSWDKCRVCGCGRTLFDCGRGMYHLMKAYA
jgi:hypothetical protein